MRLLLKVKLQLKVKIKENLNLETITMKKLFFTAVLACFVMTAFGQKKVLRNANKAFKKENYEEAVALATEASNHPDTKDNPDVYVLLGKVELEKFRLGGKNDVAQATAAYEYFKVALEKSTDKQRETMMEPPIMTQLPGQEELSQVGGSETMGLLENWLIVEGNGAYDVDDFEKAYQFIALANKIRYSDDLAIFAGYVAQLAENNEGMLEQYTMLIESESDSLPENASYAFYGVAKYHYDQKDWESALSIIEKSKERFGFDKDMANLELQVYIDADRLDDAITSLKGRIENEPEEVLNYVTLANVYFFVDRNEEAAATAKQALGMDPNNYDANYILGGAIYGEAVQLNTKAGDPSISDDEYTKLKADAKAKFGEAKPFFEKCYSIRPDDSNLYPPLATIYEKLDMDDKRDEFIEKMGN